MEEMQPYLWLYRMQELKFKFNELCLSMITLKELAKLLSMPFEGDGGILISGPSEPKTASKFELALAMSPKFLNDLTMSDARVAALNEGTDWRQLGLDGALFVKRPRYAVAQVNSLFEKSEFEWTGTHGTVVVLDSAKIGPDVSIGPFSIVGPGAVIKQGSRIGAHVSIGRGTVIGRNALIHAGVRIGSEVTVGDDFICHPNTIIGSDGFSFVSPDEGGIEQARKEKSLVGVEKIDKYIRIASLGSVIIENDVEIGAGTTIDRGTINNTIIGNGTKLDNLVHIAHNVNIGENCLLCGQVGVAGSAKIGDRVVLGGQVGVADHVHIGSDSIIAGKSGVTSNVPNGRFMMGNPAMKIENNIESYKMFRRLPRLIKRLQNLEKMILHKND